MIVIAAKIKCDHYDCENTAIVELEMTTSQEHNITNLKLEYLPDGWSKAKYNRYAEHHCPKHKEEKGY